MTEKILDPDCRQSKHQACTGGPCECQCHDVTQHDPAAERMAHVERYLADVSIHPRLADDLRDLTNFARDVLALTATAEKSDVCQHDQVCAFTIRDAAARHLGGQQ